MLGYVSSQSELCPQLPNEEKQPRRNPGALAVPNTRISNDRSSPNNPAEPRDAERHTRAARFRLETSPHATVKTLNYKVLLCFLEPSAAVPYVFCRQLFTKLVYFYDQVAKIYRFKKKKKKKAK